MMASGVPSNNGNIPEDSRKKEQVRVLHVILAPGHNINTTNHSIILKALI